MTRKCFWPALIILFAAAGITFVVVLVGPMTYVEDVIMTLPLCTELNAEVEQIEIRRNTVLLEVGYGSHPHFMSIGLYTSTEPLTITYRYTENRVVTFSWTVPTVPLKLYVISHTLAYEQDIPTCFRIG